MSNVKIIFGVAGPTFAFVKNHKINKSEFSQDLLKYINMSFWGTGGHKYSYSFLRRHSSEEAKILSLSNYYVRTGLVG